MTAGIFYEAEALRADPKGLENVSPLVCWLGSGLRCDRSGFEVTGGRQCL